MRITATLLHLPCTLLIAALALTISAVPVDSAELSVLTPDDFDSTIAEGVWFIEHFSPYCGHCRKFAPTWQKLVDSVDNQTNPGINLAQVNCAVHGDLCKQHGVDGYPQMNLYRDGKFVETYRESRDYDLLTQYLAAHAEPTPELEPEPSPIITTPAPELHVITPPEDTIRSTAPTRDLNPNGSVLSLDEKTFRPSVDEGMVFVKFFAPWCGHCKRLAPIWTELAQGMQHKLTIAEVNCEEHNSLCRAEGITGFPMLVYYAGNGAGKTEYAGGRKLEQLKAFAEKVSGPAIQELKYEDLMDRIAEHPVMYLFLHRPSDTRSTERLVQASQMLFGSPPVYMSDSGLLYDYFSVHPGSTVVLALKDNDPAPAAVFTFASTTQDADLAKWLLQNRLPASMELDSDNFQEVMNAPHKPLVVLAAARKTELGVAAEAIQKIAKQWHDAKGDVGVTFVWMDAEKWGSWLSSMYGVKLDAMPSVVIANHSQLVYYDADQFGRRIQLTQASIFSAIVGAMGGTIPYKHSENAVERMARYLNGKLTAIEVYVTEHPWRTASFVVTGVIILGLALRRVLREDTDSRAREYSYGGGLRKADRLD